ncbi:hypothetical protein Pst134EA_013243 [Puccinia striiformis f. sp. tritici]|uniref:hypothetical protein n=1 Tax=Puccinia striiformis f. sp. tritici TaxID=168172 RepID=UPI0020086FD1|nr:hypothetical protein Pst134EA_013243 [Puccinia striiformis f. sp. tritici]KAH9465357.1 hypothetical protein Pst134EA_013243 [Puccinia striiformis f. sp. tritici]
MQTQYEHLLIAILEAVADFFAAQNETMSKKHRLEEWINHSFPSANNPQDPPFWAEVERKMKEITIKPADKDKKHQLRPALSKMKESTHFIDQPNLKLLIAINEARELLKGSTLVGLTFFCIFRRALRKIPTSSPIFSILVDTTSRVANFQPPKHQEPSRRPGRLSQNKLFPPIYQIPTFDINVTGPPRSWEQLHSAF